MVIEPQVYANKREKLVDFLIGLVVWGLGNGVTYWLTKDLSLGRDWPAAGIVLIWIVVPLAANVAALAAMWSIRRWIALGGIAGFGAFLAYVGYYILLFIAVFSLIGRGL